MDEKKAFAYMVRRNFSHRALDEVRPEEFCASYRHLVQQDFSSEDLQNHYTNRTKSGADAKTKHHFNAFVNLLTRINITRDAMDDDEQNVLPLNFSAVGSVLLEFVNALSDQMGWSNMIDDFIRNNPELRTSKTTKGKVLNNKHHGLAHIWGRLLFILDSDSPKLPGIATGI
ncbi:hypothetical protein FisN_20Lu011 [Fistulifera solaris]|uniref:Uncharacterized protein n=1 Tax=Fistulifera solaris TaxID=1519565 RepID=A0A1Z5JWM9_FISSO|nr:hypothetical protein FisN_20Lu011 [Fistulifera solaris]|eukprot:GAX18252.1 hypothetical protein FisN_20Lu011 [Fistulifera solaris]